MFATNSTAYLDKAIILVLWFTSAAVHYNQLHGSKGPTPFSDRFLLGSHLSNDKLRRHYTRELGLVKVQEDAREKEEYSASFLDEIRERNRLDRLRRACRTELESDWLLEAGPQVDPVYLEPIHPDILSADADPLSYGMFIRRFRTKLFSAISNASFSLRIIW